MADCLLCDSKLQYFDHTNEYTYFCQECKKCSVCYNYIETVVDLKYCAKYHLEPTHLLCLAPEVRDEIENRKVLISQKELDFLNDVRMRWQVFEPSQDFSAETNRETARIAAHKLISDMSHEEILLFLMRCESVVAVAATTIKKVRKDIEIKLSKKESEKYLAAKSKQDVHPGPQSIAPKPKKLSPREKAVAALMRLGMSEEIAEQQIPVEVR